MFNTNMHQLLFEISMWAIPVLLAITLHEQAHALAAYKCGDHTAAMLGRLSFNPIKHIDPIGTIMVPIALLVFLPNPILFGWAKPVPVQSRNLKNPRKDMMLIALAGPLANVIMTLLWALLLKLIITALQFQLFLQSTTVAWLVANAYRGIIINIMLTVFNLLPIPPLDGSKIISAVLPYKWLPILYFLEQYGFIILALLLFSGVLLPPLQFLFFSMLNIVFSLFDLKQLLAI